MSLLLIRDDKNYDAWLKAVRDQDPDLPVFTPETLDRSEEVEMILTWKAPKGKFGDYNNVKVIGSMGAGADHLFEDPSLPEKVIITRVVDDFLKVDMREFVLALVLNATQNLSPFVHLQQEKKWDRLPYRRAADVRVGIMGLGVLGASVARLLVKVGFEVSGWSNSSKNIDQVKSFAGPEHLDDFLAKAEILVCLLPLTEETQGILNQSVFYKLPKNAYVINVARGGHLVDEDLIEALDNGQLSGAALDVFHKEPLPEGHPFWSHSKILVTPHLASMTTAASIGPQIVENYRKMKNGEELLNTIVRQRGY